MRSFATAWTALILATLGTPALADARLATALAAETYLDDQQRTEEAFAALGYVQRPPKTPRVTKRKAEATTQPENNVMVFAGQYTKGNLGNTLNPFYNDVENQGLIAIAYGRDFYRWYGFAVGAEIGAALRFGMEASGEFWGGVNFRHIGFTLFDTVRIGAGITVGLSVVTRATGIEAQREVIDNGDATLLVYLGPEFTLAALNNPNLELVYRIQHRSGAYGLFANFIEGANAHTLGLRYRF